MHYKLVIFDFDGTLADSGDWFISIMDDLSDRFGLRRVDPNEIQALRNRSTREVIEHFGISRWKLPRISRHVRRRAGEDAEQIRLFDGVTELLAALHAAGVKIALVTSNAEANARRILGAENAARISWFACGASLFGKPAKFRRIVKLSGIAPDEIVSIGDETRDIDAARVVGTVPGAVTWGYATREALERHRPDALFDAPEEIATFVTGMG